MSERLIDDLPCFPTALGDSAMLRTDAEEMQTRIDELEDELRSSREGVVSHIARLEKEANALMDDNLHRTQAWEAEHREWLRMMRERDEARAELKAEKKEVEAENKKWNDEYERDKNLLTPLVQAFDPENAWLPDAIEKAIKTTAENAALRAEIAKRDVGNDELCHQLKMANDRVAELEADDALHRECIRLEQATANRLAKEKKELEAAILLCNYVGCTKIRARARARLEAQKKASGE